MYAYAYAGNCIEIGDPAQKGARNWLLAYFQFDLEVERFEILQMKSKKQFFSFQNALKIIRNENASNSF